MRNRDRIAVQAELRIPPRQAPISSPIARNTLMPATILDGKQLAQQLRSELAEDVIEFIQNNGVVPSLAAVLVGDDPASEVYIRGKRRACEAVGIESQLHRLGGDASSD